jgi:hypothetical protein
MFQQVMSQLNWYRGKWITKNGQLGDAHSANAAMALVTPKDQRVHEYVAFSFRKERPFRSPVHAADPNTDLIASFSRDHVLSLCWYSMWSSKCWPLSYIAHYAAHHKLKIGAEGTYSQHGLTPNIMWAMHVVCHHHGQPLPWWFSIWPGFIIAIIQLISARTVAVGYRLNLCAEMAMLARVTGRWNWIWQRVANKCVERQPENLYYRLAAGEDRDKIRQELEVLMGDYKPSGDWCWCWMARAKDGRLKACGPDLLLVWKLVGGKCED